MLNKCQGEKGGGLFIFQFYSIYSVEKAEVKSTLPQQPVYQFLLVL